MERTPRNEKGPGGGLADGGIERVWQAVWIFYLVFTARRLLNMAIALGDKGIRCSFPPFIRSAGITQIFVLGVISCHFAPRTSFDLVAVRMRNSKVRAAIDSDLRSCVMNAGIVAILSMERKPEIVKSIPSFPYILKSL
jgi:hypothetical protein